MPPAVGIQRAASRNMPMSCGAARRRLPRREASTPGWWDWRPGRRCRAGPRARGRWRGATRGAAAPTSQFMLSPSASNLSAARLCIGSHGSGVAPSRRYSSGSGPARARDRVDAGGVRLEHPARLGAEAELLVAGHAVQPHPADEAVDVDAVGPDQLADPAGGDAAGHLHLPEPILGVGHAHREGRVLHRGRRDVGHAPAIAADRRRERRGRTSPGGRAPWAGTRRGSDGARPAERYRGRPPGPPPR